MTWLNEAKPGLTLLLTSVLSTVLLNLQFYCAFGVAGEAEEGRFLGGGLKGERHRMRGRNGLVIMSVDTGARLSRLQFLSCHLLVL